MQTCRLYHAASQMRNPKKLLGHKTAQKWQNQRKIICHEHLSKTILDATVGHSVQPSDNKITALHLHSTKSLLYLI